MTGGVTTITTAITIIIIIIIITTDATLRGRRACARRPLQHPRSVASLEYHRSIAGTDHGEACAFLSCDAAAISLCHVDSGLSRAVWPE